MKSTIAPERRAAIATYLKGRHIPSGMGTEEASCSVAAINLALYGELTDRIPDCMSRVMGRWIIVIQDAMPDAMRNGDEWRDALPLAAGTGRDNEAERLAIIMDWMWGTVLPTIQPIADKYGFGVAWRAMTTERTLVATRGARAAADAAADAAAAAADAEAAAADAEAQAAARAAAEVAAAVAAAETAAAAMTAERTLVATRGARAAAAAVAAVAAVAAAESSFWEAVNPPALLVKLIEAAR